MWEWEKSENKMQNCSFCFTTKLKWSIFNMAAVKCRSEVEITIFSKMDYYDDIFMVGSTTAIIKLVKQSNKWSQNVSTVFNLTTYPHPAFSILSVTISSCVHKFTCKLVNHITKNPELIMFWIETENYLHDIKLFYFIILAIVPSICSI